MGGPIRRRLHAKILLALQSAVGGCYPIPGMERFCRPPTKVCLTAIFADLAEDPDDAPSWRSRFPWGLAGDHFISMAWDGMRFSTEVRFAWLELDQQTTLFFHSDDTETEGLYFVAAAVGMPPNAARSAFLHELFGSNGRTFEADIFGSLPSEVVSTIADEDLVEYFILAADCGTLQTGSTFWEELSQMMIKRRRRFDLSDPKGRRDAVKLYLRSIPRSRFGRAPEAT